jgi:ATP synthase protein I
MREPELPGTKRELDEAARLRARLDALKADLAQKAGIEAEAQKQDAQEASTGSDMAAGLRMTSELVAGTLVGFAIGYSIDAFFGSSPFGLIGFLLIGFGAGFRNIYKLGMRPTTPQG